jgi:hypothetical protein
MRVLPRLVYVPFGLPAHPIDVRLNRALARDRITLRIGSCERIDMERHTVYLNDGSELVYDAVVVAPGAMPMESSGFRLRSLEDAVRLRHELEQLAAQQKQSWIQLRVPEACTWQAPAFEVALLMAQWKRERSLDHLRITMMVEGSEPLDMFSYEASQIIRERLALGGVELLASVDVHRLDQLPCDLAIDFDGLQAHRIPGLPPLDPDGFYFVDGACRAAPGVFVVGDASDLPFKAGFAVSWQARKVATALGGDLSLLGTHIDGIPLQQCEYQMDLGGETLCIRFDTPRLPDTVRPIHRVERIDIVPGRPDKLAGTLVRPLVATGSYRPVVASALSSAS